MGKSINSVIDDRIDDGLDAWHVAIKLAKTDEHPDVVDQAEAASRALTTAVEAWRAVDSVRRKCVADERALAQQQAADARQGTLPGTTGEDGCVGCLHLLENGGCNFDGECEDHAAFEAAADTDTDTDTDAEGSEAGPDAGPEPGDAADEVD